MLSGRLRRAVRMTTNRGIPKHYLWTLGALLLMLMVIVLRSHSVRRGITSGCRPRSFKAPHNIVCVCTGAYCDTIPPLPSNLPHGKAALYLTSWSGKRFHYEEISGTDAKGPTGARSVTVAVDPSSTKQSIIGFGGAFTDAAVINIASLSNNTQARLIESCFGQCGSEYTIGRIPIASCDFSTREYSYDDVPGDFPLMHFALAKEDIQYKIPTIKKAISASKGTFKLIGTPWSAPGWMKTTGRMKGNGTLIGSAGDKYHKTWANYFVKFIQEYARNDLDIWGLTVGNEPSMGFAEDYLFQAMGYTAEMERDFVKTDLGPILAANNLDHVRLMMLDDNRYMLEEWADTILNDSLAAKYISGIALHWYGNPLSPVDSLDYAHNRYPGHFILSTEACTGFPPFDSKGPILGDWSRGERYAHDIIETINHWASGWVDWNMVLNMNGGPNWAETFADAPIIVNKAADEFYKQPMYYALGHFSKFVRPDSVCIESKVSESADQQDTTLEVVAFIRPDGKRVAVALNRDERSCSVVLKEKGSNNHFQFNMDAHSIATIIWDA